MKIGLIDVDSHNFPNLALMKISAYEKAQGNEVEWWNGLKHYDRVYQAKVFDDSYTNDIEWCVDADEIIKGGTGYNLGGVLRDEIEHIYPDYSIYPEYTKDTAYGFLTRGCPRGCPFCIVAQKEGRKVRTTASVSEFWDGQKHLTLLDNNITASTDYERLLDELVDTGAWVDFQSGLDIRLMDEKKAAKLNKVKAKMLHFAWDNYEFQTYEKLKGIRPHLDYTDRNLVVYVLTNFNTTHEQDLDRIYKLKEAGYSPYVMIYDKNNAPRLTRKMARWCNNRFIFRAVERFEDYV